MKKTHIIIIITLIIIDMGLLTFLGFFGGGQPVYDTVEAGKVTYANLPEDLKSKMTRQDVDLILELKFQYQQKVGLTSDSNIPAPTEPVVMDDKLNQFIIGEAKKSSKDYLSADVDEVLDAEEVYLRQIGAIKE